MKYFCNLVLLLALIPQLALGARTVTADQIKNGLQTQTYTVPTATGTLITTAQERTSNYGLIGEILTNPDFEAPTYSTGWSVSGGTLAAAAGTNILFGAKSATWDSSSASQTFCSDAIAIPEGYYGANGEAEINVKTPSGTATHILSVVNGATTLQPTKTIFSSTTSVPQRIQFQFPTSGNIQICLTSVNANEPLIAVDDAHLGKPRYVGSTQLISEWVTYTPTGSWVSNTTYTGKWRRVGDSLQAEVKVLTSGTPTALDFTASIPSGLTIDTNKLVDTGVQAVGYAHAGIGTNYTGVVLIASTTTIRVITNATSVWSSTVPGSWTNGSYGTMMFTVPIVGWTSQQIVMPDTQGLSWSGYHGDDCSFARTNTAFGDPTADATCTFTERQNRNFGAVTSQLSGADKLPGIVFTPKVSGRYFICAIANSFGPNSAAVNLGHQLTDGTTVIGQANRQTPGTGQEVAPLSICSIYNASAGSAATVKLQTRSGSGAITMAAPTAGSTAVEWSIFNMDQPVSAILANSVSTANNNGDRISRVRTSVQCSASPCAIADQSGDVTNITRAGAGNYTVNFSTAFSSPPTCQSSVGSGAAFSGTQVQSVTASTAQVVYFNTNTQVQLDPNEFYVICMGPR